MTEPPSDARRLHEDEISIDVSLVRTLVDTQFPQHAGKPLSRLTASGSTNVMFRLGDDLLVRLPRQPGGGAGIDKERRWLPFVARHLPVAVPEIVALGEPGSGYGERWSIVRWLEGAVPAAHDPSDRPNPDRLRLAAELAETIRALRGTAVPEAAAVDASLRTYRGRALAEFDATTRDNLRKCRAIEELDLDLESALAIWEAALATAVADRPGPDCWYHGDLVAENLLLTGGRLTGVLDFGGLGVGDPAIDLHGVWEVLDRPGRALFRDRLGVDDAEWVRGRAWALAIALGTFTYYWDTMPGRRRDRVAMARSVLADAAESIG